MLMMDPSSIVSPQKYAKEQQERFLMCLPMQADVEPFSEVPINLIAYQKPTQQQIKLFHVRAISK
jgi:hypothetical protein